MSEQQPHNFDRRRSDVKFDALAARVTILEERFEVLEEKQERNIRELAANTALTRQIHEGLYGRGEEEDHGIKGKVDEMHDLFAEGRSGLRFIGRVADGTTRAVKPALYLVGLGGAITLWMKTGEWRWPPW